MKAISGGATAAKGFRAGGLWCGIKKSGKPDLALITSEVPAFAAGVFTINGVAAAPVRLSRRHLKNGRARAIVANSGNANCFTGAFGMLYAKQTAQRAAELLGVEENEIVVASTGVIGQPLPIDRILNGLPKLAQSVSKQGHGTAARAILTTDTFIKEYAVRYAWHGRPVTVGGCAKGSGMIDPCMATMLAFITTDAAVDPGALNQALKEAVEPSFNSITVDGCMSTNDMVVVLANGRSQTPLIRSARQRPYRMFVEALTAVCVDLAKKIVRDGEGATKFITIKVTGGRTRRQAKEAARRIANSNLVKTAAYGENPNWGRIAAAVGSLGPAIREDKLRISFSSFKKKDILIHVDLGLGDAEGIVYTCDLSREYIRINALYN